MDKKKLQSILCFLSIHKWLYTNDDQTERICLHCKREEFLDLESDVNPWGNPLWLKKE